MRTRKKQTHRRPETWEAKLGTSSFDPLSVMELQDAVRDRREKVKLNGREFALKYSEDGKTVYYSPIEGFAPAGHLEIKRLLEG